MSKKSLYVDIIFCFRNDDGCACAVIDHSTTDKVVLYHFLNGSKVKDQTKRFTDHKS